MAFSAFAPSVSSAATTASVSQTTKPIRRPSAVVGCKTTIARARRGDTGLVKFGCPRRSSMNVLVYAAGGEGDDLDDEENARRAAEPEVEVIEGDEEVEEPAAVEASKCNELLGKLQEAVEAGNAADVLADVLPELTSEVSGIESAFGDIQAANVGLKDQADTLKDQYLRLNADFDNFKKRTLKEKEQLSQTAKSKFFEALLPALDNFDLAQANLKPENEEAQKIVSQYQGLVDGLMTILTNQGLSTVAGVGAPFDPNFHEAIMREESADAPEDTILEEFRKGYKMGENTLIRPAMVKVAAAPSE
mmetsp:Transcript_13784/g.58364  ORF Transcript_13784/g.58364 Transcript_13784/m.58364 type:complete len:305 (-) Transcript_13784:40-954(-)